MYEYIDKLHSIHKGTLLCAVLLSPEDGLGQNLEFQHWVRICIFTISLLQLGYN